MRFSITKREVWLVEATGVIAWLGTWLYPVGTELSRALGAALSAAVWFGLGALLWRWRAWHYAWVCVTLFISVFFMLPGRGHRDTGAMRSEAAEALLRYQGTRYVWGGESPTGIDCSGLMRRGMIDGMFLQGLRTIDPGLARWAVWLWWNDCSAKDLGNGNSMTTHVLDTPSIDALDDSQILPRDMAVTTTGIHVIGYLGDHTWIEADPDAKKVISVKTPSDNPWFRERMKIVRWNVLQ